MADGDQVPTNEGGAVAPLSAGSVLAPHRAIPVKMTVTATLWVNPVEGDTRTADEIVASMCTMVDEDWSISDAFLDADDSTPEWVDCWTIDGWDTPTVTLEVGGA